MAVVSNIRSNGTVRLTKCVCSAVHHESSQRRRASPSVLPTRHNSLAIIALRVVFEDGRWKSITTLLRLIYESRRAI